MITPKISEGSYATYEVFDELSYNCIEYLMNNDEMVWRLLYYNTPDAWDEENLAKPNLNQEQKASLIYNGSDNTANYNVFMDMGQPDVETEEKCIIRIHPYNGQSPNRVVGTVLVMFEVYTHYKLNHLSNYKTRNDMILKRFIKVFNGVAIKSGIGNMHLDNMGSYGTRIETGGQLPWRGKYLLMAIRTT